MWHMGDGWGWWMVVGWVWMAVFWGLIIWAVYAIISRLTGGRETPPVPPREPTAIEILERRYAHGELTDDEFEAMRERLMHPPTAPTGSDGQTTGMRR
jgi:putative membrane protein